MSNPSLHTRCPQCRSFECGSYRCRFSGLTHHDFANGATPMIWPEERDQPETPPLGTPGDEDAE